jgi:hypothetical protein
MNYDEIPGIEYDQWYSKKMFKEYFLREDFEILYIITRFV